ncbi:MAG: lactate utilization protein [Tissierellia bacterium]|nr:lactate utilization protein [Tissierellia bacterium]
MDFTGVRKNLEALGYQVAEFERGQEAVDYLVQKIRGKTVGIGGSLTVDQLGLYGALKAHNQVYWHWYPQEGEDPLALRYQALGAQVYIASVNGLAESGEIVNIDGAGNRVAGLSTSREAVYLIVGQNKLAQDLEEAKDRAQNLAAPKNAHRLGVKTPCALKGDRCYDCQSPERICRVYSILKRPPSTGGYHLILIHEDLGY